MCRLATFFIAKAAWQHFLISRKQLDSLHCFNMHVSVAMRTLLTAMRTLSDVIGHYRSHIVKLRKRENDIGKLVGHYPRAYMMFAFPHDICRCSPLQLNTRIARFRHGFAWSIELILFDSLRFVGFEIGWLWSIICLIFAFLSLRLLPVFVLLRWFCRCDTGVSAVFMLLACRWFGVHMGRYETADMEDIVCEEGCDRRSVRTDEMGVVGFCIGECEPHGGF